MEERKDITAAIRESYLIIIWFIIVVAIRVFLLLSGKAAVLDDFGFFELTKSTEWKTALTSGVAFAYEGMLSLFMKLTGQSMGFVPIYHTVLQTVALFLLFIGCRQMFGKGPAFFVGTILGLSPWLIKSIFQVSPGNFYFFHWAVVFFLVGIFCKRTEEIGWFRSNAGELYLIVTGFYMGVVCAWHYAGLLLIPFVLYAQIKNASSLRDRIRDRQNILDMEEIMSDDEEDEWDDDWDAEPEDELIVDSREYMPTLSQSGILTFGALFGAYCTLMKYTGVTGNFIKEQIVWWLGLYRKHMANGLWQDIPLSLILWIGGAILAGAVFSVILHIIYRRKKLEAAIHEAEEYLKESESADRKNEMENGDWSYQFEPEPEAETESESEPELMEETVSEPEVELKEEVQPEPESETVPELKEEVQPEPELPDENEFELESEPEQKEPESVETESEPEQENPEGVEIESESESETEPEPELEEKSESELETEKETGSESSDVSQEEVEKPKKKVELIENPLPVPKRQVRPKVEFDVDDQDDDFDFDIDIDSDDDFDF